MKENMSFAKKLPLYYLAGVSVFVFLFAVYQQSPQFEAMFRKDSSFAAEVTTISYKATAGFNQDGNPSNDPYNSTEAVWFGNGASTNNSYLGLQFSNVSLQNLSRASLKVTSTGDSWISQSIQIYAEKTNSPQPFTKSALPGSRSLTSASVSYADNVKWLKDRAYSMPDITDVIKEVASLSQTANVSLILKGTGSSYGRKFVFGTSSDKAPTLVIESSAGSTGATASPAPVVTATPSPTTTPTSSAPAKTTVPATAMPSNMPMPSTVSTGVGTASYAMGLWNPTRFDSCTKDEHDSFFVIGPDGKKYPTWHPPTLKRANGTICTFGHEHGRDPKGYAYYDEIRKHFAYDADRNGIISSSELASAGIPFGYVNEQIDVYTAAQSNSTPMMRHEDHVGHKVEYANGEGDIGSGTDPFDNLMTGGIVVPVKSSTGKWAQSGIRCYHFHKIHQGVHSPDALTNNIHEIVMHEKCTSTIAQYAPSTTILTGMIQFGAAGEFTKLCGNDRTTIIKLGTTTANQNFPGSSAFGSRGILTRDCVEQTVLVSPPAFSAFPYEIWDGRLTIKSAAGKDIVANGGAWEVLDAIRYYNPNSANRISYNADTCYENFNGRTTRGGACDYMTDFGSIKGITWDDPRSAFRGVNRGQYINPPIITNANGQEYWYTDPFGNNGQATPFPGSIRQYVSKVNASLAGLNTDPRIIQRYHDDGVVGGKTTVHAPN